MDKFVFTFALFYANLFQLFLIPQRRHLTINFNLDRFIRLEDPVKGFGMTSVISTVISVGILNVQTFLVLLFGGWIQFDTITSPWNCTRQFDPARERGCAPSLNPADLGLGDRNILVHCGGDLFVKFYIYEQAECYLIYKNDIFQIQHKQTVVNKARLLYAVTRFFLQKTSAWTVWRMRNDGLFTWEGVVYLCQCRRRGRRGTRAETTRWHGTSALACEKT